MASVEEIKETPGRVAEATKKIIVESVVSSKSEVTQKVEETVKSVKETVEVVVSLPGKAIDEVSIKS